MLVYLFIYDKNEFYLLLLLNVGIFRILMLCIDAFWLLNSFSISDFHLSYHCYKYW